MFRSRKVIQRQNVRHFGRILQSLQNTSPTSSLLHIGVPVGTDRCDSCIRAWVHRYEKADPISACTTMRSAVSHTASRWVILAIFSSLGCLQCLVWGTYGPISTCVDRMYGWDKQVITTFSIFGPAVFIPTSFVISWVTRTRGLRCTMLIGASMLLVGTSARLMSSQPPSAFRLVVLCQLLASATGPVALALPPKISNTWFAAH